MPIRRFLRGAFSAAWLLAAMLGCQESSRTATQAAPALAYTISGSLGASGAGAWLTYTDGALKTAAADGSGNYYFTVPANWSGTVTPSKTGCTFSPASQTFSNVLSSQLAAPTITTPITFTLSGALGAMGAGSTLSYTDGSAKTATADNSGNFSFTVSYNWSGTVTPSKRGFAFTPASQTFASMLADKAAAPTTCAALVYTLSGTLGPIGAGATLSYLDGTARTATADGSGNFSFVVSYDWSGLVTPSKPGITFTPASLLVGTMQANQAVSFSSAPTTFLISGSLGPLGAGATLTYVDGTAKTATADGSGNYSFTVSYTWSGTVTPTKTGFSFSPASRTYSNQLAHSAAQNYATSPITYTISGTLGAAGAGTILSYTDGSAKTATADGSGNYSFTVSYTWSGTVIPTKTGFSFSPANRIYTNLLASLTAQNFVAMGITFTLTGGVGAAGAGTVLAYTDGSPGTVVADGSGNYTLVVSFSWSGAVTPSKPGFTFTPTSRTYTNVLANQTGQDFSSTAITYTLSGALGASGAGATLAYTDGSAKTTTADGSGNYSFTVSYNWSGTVTPTKTGFSFSPASRTYTNLLANSTAQDYTTTAITYTLSGALGASGAGATLAYTDGSAKTATADGSGNYSFTVSYNWSGTVTPSKTAYTFTPASKTYTNVLADQTAQDYATNSAATYTLSGSLGAAGGGATLTYTGGSTSADGFGNYSFTAAGGWSGTVTPSLAGKIFTPTSRTYSSLAANQTGQDFTTTATGNNKAITSLAFLAANNGGIAQDYAATISGDLILVSLPSATTLTALKATFTTTGVSVAIGATPQTSDVTANDFTGPLAYTVTAADASTATYTVSVVPGNLSVMGSYTDAATKPQAFYWKDGRFYGLPVPGTPGLVSAFSLCQDGGSIYIAGRYTNASAQQQACYWTIDAASNVSRTDLPFTGSTERMAASITALSGQLYIAGQVVIGGAWVGVTWSGPPGSLVEQALTPPGGTRSIGISASTRNLGTLYTGGAYVPAFPWKSLPVYWPGSGAAQTPALPATGQSGWITAIYGDASHVYAGAWWDPGVTGNSSQQRPFYYRDWSTVVDLYGTIPSGQLYGCIQGINGDGTDTYMAGWYGTSATATTPCYWKVNAGASQPTPVALSMPGGGVGAALYSTVKSSSPYFSGYYTVTSVDHPCYWTANGASVDLSGCLPTGALGGRANGVYFQ